MAKHCARILQTNNTDSNDFVWIFHSLWQKVKELKWKSLKPFVIISKQNWKQAKWKLFLKVKSKLNLKKWNQNLNRSKRLL
jgi:hypothetical protein